MRFRHVFSPATPACRIRAASLLLLPSLLLVLLSGCIALPVRVPAKTLGPQGADGSDDLSFIRAGVTTREEVAAHLAWMDTGYKNDRRFYGRWIGSKWAVAWAVGGYYAGQAGANRMYGAHNLIVEFDADGKVKAFHMVPEEALFRELAGWVARGEEPPLDLSRPVQVSAAHRHAINGAHHDALLLLGRDEFEFRELENTSHNFRVPAAQLARIGVPSSFGKGEADPNFIYCVIEFKPNTPAGSKMKLRANVLTVLALLRYARDVHIAVKQ